MVLHGLCVDFHHDSNKALYDGLVGQEIKTYTVWRHNISMYQHLFMIFNSLLAMVLHGLCVDFHHDSNNALYDGFIGQEIKTD